MRDMQSAPWLCGEQAVTEASVSLRRRRVRKGVLRCTFEVQFAGIASYEWILGIPKKKETRISRLLVCSLVRGAKITQETKLPLDVPPSAGPRRNPIL